MRRLILATALAVAILGNAAAQGTITILGPNGAITHVTPLGKDTLIVTPILPPTPPAPPPPAPVTAPVWAPLPPTITHTPGSNWYNR